MNTKKLIQLIRKKKEGSQKGISLFMTMVMMAIIMAMVLGVTAIIINGLNMIEGVSDSVKAFHAADTGIEQALYNIRVDGDCVSPCPSSAPCSLGTNWSYSLDYSGGCSTTSINIVSEGYYYGAQREIKVSY
ncbi:MAG: hypothetical protein WC397_01920 [Candidatus Paceibacterota bacterium]|jgi:Tfp pilus assembly protein PilX